MTFGTRFARLLASIALAAVTSACASASRTPATTPPSAPPATPPTAPVPPARSFSRAEVRTAIDSLVALPAFRTANWGILVVSATSGDTLYAHNATKLFVPASNTKLITGAVALAALGPDYRWKTRFSAHGELRDGVLRGDLVVSGGGDPTVSNRMANDALIPLRMIADSLAARGITRIAGRLVRGGNAFPDSRIGAGWQWDYLNAGYAAGVDDLFFNEGVVIMTVTGAEVAGAPAIVSSSPARSYPVIINEALTRPEGSEPRRSIRFDLDSATGVVYVRGSLAATEIVTQTLTLADPASAYLTALREVLAARGIVVDSAVAPRMRVQEREVMDSLFTFHSLPLSLVLKEMMKPSQNQLAEIFLKTIGLEVTGVGSADSGLRVVREQVIAWGAEPDGFALRDGSGLTRNNFISPETLIRMLGTIRGMDLYPLFHSSLPIAGVDGTLRSRMAGTPAAGNLRGKTGTLARASAMGGYVTTLDGEELIFSLFCNNFTAPAGDVTGMQNTIGVMLASMEWNR